MPIKPKPKIEWTTAVTTPDGELIPTREVVRLFDHACGIAVEKSFGRVQFHSAKLIGEPGAEILCIWFSGDSPQLNRIRRDDDRFHRLAPLRAEPELKQVTTVIVGDDGRVVEGSERTVPIVGDVPDSTVTVDGGEPFPMSGATQAAFTFAMNHNIDLAQVPHPAGRKINRFDVIRHWKALK